MKKCQIILPMIILVYSSIGYSQDEIKAVVSNPDKSEIYVGMDNTINVAVPNYPCEKVYATIDNGILTGSGCSYIARPATRGSANINVFTIKNQDTVLVNSFTFRARLMPNPVVFMSGKHDVPISIGELKVQKGIYAEIESFAFDAKFNVLSFKVNNKRGSNVTADSNNEGTLFNKATKGIFSNTQPGDIITIYDVTVLGPDGLKRDLDPISFTITQ